MKITGAVLEEIGAARPFAETKPLKIVELELDAPGPDEVLVRIRAAGLCHSDLSVVDGNRPRPTPMLLGHEASGIVEQVGANVTDLKPGQQVSTVFLPRCGECENCLTDGKLPCLPGTATNNAGQLPGEAVVAAVKGAGAADAAAPAAALGPASAAASTSSLRMRPPTPEPVRPLRSTPRSFASLRTMGVTYPA